MNKEISKWEFKDRVYRLKSRKSPLTYKVKSRGLIFWDEELNMNREIRYAINQNSPFVDEQDGSAILGHIIFENGSLFVPKSNPVLQQILSIYHPKADEKWYEVKPEVRTENFVDAVEAQLEAMNLVNELDIEHLEAIMRTELGSSVTSMSSKELKRDAYRFARHNPSLFMEVANDEDIKLRNLANRAVEMGILNLTADGTTFKLAGSGKKVMTVPFDTNPYAALAQYFKTDKGIDLMKSITKKLS